MQALQKNLTTNKACFKNAAPAFGGTSMKICCSAFSPDLPADSK